MGKIGSLKEFKIAKLKEILKKLAKKRVYFCSEADFQFSLALEIQKNIDNEKIKIRLEYPEKIIVNKYDIDIENIKIEKSENKYNNDDNSIAYIDYDTYHVDIMLIEGNKLLPIELKYKTAKLSPTEKEDYELATVGARSDNCYLYWKDIERIENIRKKIENSNKEFIRGFTIMLTNNDDYIRLPKNNTVSVFSLKQVKNLGKRQIKYCIENTKVQDEKRKKCAIKKIAEELEVQLNGKIENEEKYKIAKEINRIKHKEKKYIILEDTYQIDWYFWHDFKKTNEINKKGKNNKQFYLLINTIEKNQYKI